MGTFPHSSLHHSNALPFLVRTKVYLLILVLLVPLGLSTKMYHGPFQVWVHSYAGDIFYPMFWYFLLRLIWNDLSKIVCAVAVFVACTLIEFGQLLTFSFLTSIRKSFLGALLLGSGFDWPDILYYGIGVVAAVGIDHLFTQGGGKIPPLHEQSTDL